jgi:hypothetical protein
MEIESSSVGPLLVRFLTPPCHCHQHRVFAPRLSANLLCDLVAIHRRHAEIQQNHVGPPLGRDFQHVDWTLLFVALLAPTNR